MNNARSSYEFIKTLRVVRTMSPGKLVSLTTPPLQTSTRPLPGRGTHPQTAHHRPRWGH